jgi:hypothetical protein
MLLNRIHRRYFSSSSRDEIMKALALLKDEQGKAITESKLI